MRIGVILLLLLVSESFVGQSLDHIELYHPERQKTQHIDIGQRIGLRLTDDTKWRGRLEEVGKDSITVGGRSFAYTELNYIGHRTTWTMIGGALLTLTGVGVVTSGVLLIIDSSEQGLIISSTILAIGAGIASLGPILFLDGKRYYLDSDWKLMSRYL